MRIEENRGKMTYTDNKLVLALKEEIKMLKEEVEHCLYTDSITGLKNKRALLKDMGKSSIPTLFLIDINDYARYIDIYGTEISNELLNMFAEVLEAFNDEKGYQLYHIEIDTFCLLHPSEYIDTQKYESDIFELLETVIENPLYIPYIDDMLFINVNIGIASEIHNLLNHAYDALNSAKKSKNNLYITVLSTNRQMSTVLSYM